MLSRTLLRPSLIARGAITARTYATAVSHTRLTPKQIEIVKSTIPALQQHGVAITTLFYKRLLANHPELKNLFNLSHQATGIQPAALAHSVWAYASNIEHPEALQAAISRIGHKHASLGVTADQYPIVGEGLLAAIKDTLGDAVTPEVVDAWTAAYQQLAELFISFESDLYRESASRPGGWNGWRKFFIKQKVVESDEIVSFHLVPVDKGRIPSYKPGQFVCIRCFIPELGLYQPRQYSLSAAPGGEYFQISVKREFARGDKPAGRASNVLHESLPEGAEVELSMPFGDFVVDVNATTPVVLISGGVGLTPMMSMLQTLTGHQGNTRRISFIHAVRNSRVHAMKDRLAHIMRENPQVSRAVFYEEVSDADKQGVDYDFKGRIELDKIKDQAVLPDADYYICGPLPFMKAQSQSLKSLGVDPERIHMEVFGSVAE
jgi:ferredoxin-NADP reductase/hemoglobin-like flavoprotein